MSDNREIVLRRATADAQSWFCSIIDTHDLTYGEVMSVLAALLRTWSRWQINEERNPSTPSPE